MTFSRPSIRQIGISTDFDRPRTPSVGAVSRREGPIGSFTPGGGSPGPSLSSSVLGFFSDIAPSVEKGLNQFWDNQAKQATASFFDANPGITARSLGDDPTAQAALLQMNPRARQMVATNLANTALADVREGYATAALADPTLNEPPPPGADQTQWMAQQRLRRQEIYQQQLDSSGFKVLPQNLQADVLEQLAPAVGQVNGKLRGIQALRSRDYDNAIYADSAKATLSGVVALDAYGDGMVPPVDDGAVDVTAVPLPRGGDFAGGASVYSDGNGWVLDKDAEQSGYDVTLPGGEGGMVPSPIEGLRITGTGMQGAGSGPSGRGYGNWVSAEFTGKDGKPYEVLLGHFDRVNVKTGDVLSKGELIGHQGNTGRSYGAHVTTHVNALEGGDPWKVLKDEVVDPWVKGWKRDPAAAMGTTLATTPQKEQPTAEERKAQAQEASEYKGRAQQGFDDYLTDLLGDGGRSYAEVAGITVQGLSMALDEIAIGPDSRTNKARAQLGLLNRTQALWENSKVKRGKHSLLHVPMTEGSAKGMTPMQWINQQRVKIWSQLDDDPEVTLQTSPQAWGAASRLALGSGDDAQRSADVETVRDFLLPRHGIAKTADFLTAAIGSGETIQNFRVQGEVDQYLLQNPQMLDGSLTQEQSAEMFDDLMSSDLSPQAKVALSQKLAGANKTAGEVAMGELVTAGKAEYVQDITQARQAVLSNGSMIDPQTRQLATDGDAFTAEYNARVKAEVDAEVADRRAKGENLNQQDLLEIGLQKSREVREQYIKASQGGDGEPRRANEQYLRAGERLNYVRTRIELNGGVVDASVFPPDLRKRVGNDVRKLEREFEKELAAVRRMEKGEMKAPFANGKWYGSSEGIMQRLKRDANKDVVRPGETTRSQARYDRWRAEREKKLKALGQPPELLNYVQMPEVPASPATPPAAPSLPSSEGGGSGGGQTTPQRQDYVDSYVATGMAANLGAQLSPRAKDDPMVSFDPAGALRNLLNRTGIPNMMRIMSGQERITPSTPALPQVDAKTKLQPLPTVINSKNHPIAIAVGVSEGTRTPDGGRTKAWHGHWDPNVPGRWNVGTYSADSKLYPTPEAADAAWDRRMTKKASQVAQILQRLGLRPDQAGYHRIMFNVIDLEGQAPLANGMDGFLGKLPEVVRAGATIEAIAKARADSYYNPKTGKLETTFRSYADLLADQRRRAGSYDYKRRLN